MRKATAILLIFAMVSSMAFGAENVQSLSPDDRIWYLSNALSIETEAKTEMLGTSYDWGYPGGFSSSYASGTTSTEWIPYKGAERISRKEFFQLAELPDMVKAEEEIENKTKSMHIAGGVLLGVGSVAAIAGLLLGWNLTSEDAGFVGTICLACGGAVAAGISIPLLMYETESDVAISFAVNIANGYNQKLLESLN